MAVKIGHASLDERGTAKGGAAGDQTGKEVCTRNWYSKGWNVVLRPKSAALAEKSARACEAACDNPNIGYDQGGRNTLNDKAKAVGYDLAAISEKCECDCSSLMHVCAIAGGANLEYGSNGYTTSTMVRAYVASGDYTKLTDSKYLTGDTYLRRGDILVKEGSHTAMALEDGTKAGTAQGMYTPEVVTIYYSVRLPMLTKGMNRDTVWAMQKLLMARGYKLPEHGADGDFGDETEEALMRYQENMNLVPDGKCGPETWSALLGLTGVG
jgi:hypothetical protein